MYGFHSKWPEVHVQEGGGCILTFTMQHQNVSCIYTKDILMQHLCCPGME